MAHKNKTHICVLSCGSSDDTYFWKEKDVVYALSINEGLGYCGVEAFVLTNTPNTYTDGRTFEADSNPGLFLQVDHEIESVLGKRGLDLNVRTILNRMLHHVEA